MAPNLNEHFALVFNEDSSIEYGHEGRTADGSEYIEMKIPTSQVEEKTQILHLVKHLTGYHRGNLLVKLEKKGISRRIVRWIESWLKERRKWAVLKGKLSDWREVSSGVQEGSVLQQ